jgi:hypothetical protein
MNLLIFIGLHFILFNEVSSGPHVDYLFGWINLHRKFDGHFHWNVEAFDLKMLVAIVLISTLLTWAFSKALKSKI